MAKNLTSYLVKLETWRGTGRFGAPPSAIDIAEVADSRKRPKRTLRGHLQHARLGHLQFAFAHFHSVLAVTCHVLLYYWCIYQYVCTYVVCCVGGSKAPPVLHSSYRTVFEQDCAV